MYYSMSLYDIINLCFIGTKQQYNYTTAYTLNACNLILSYTYF